MAKPSAKQMEAFRKLGYSDEQIAEMLEDDEAVDKGESMEWDLSKEEHKKAMKNANTGERKKPITFDKTPRPRKEDSAKRTIINAIFEFLGANERFSPDNVVISNPEQKVSFDFDGENYTISLTRHRKPKN